MFFIINEIGGLSGQSNPGLWAEMEQGHFFCEYDMEGVSLENNEIYFELVPEKLSKIVSSLRTSQSTKSLKMKLTKKHLPCLTFHIEMPSLSARSRTVVHDVPINLIPRRLWHMYQEPVMPSFEVSINLPPLRQLKHVIDRLKNLSSHVTLSANRQGTFIISVTTDAVDVSTYFKNLSTPVWDKEQTREISDELFSATIDIKKFSMFLMGEQVNPSKVICNIVNGKTVHLFLLHNDVTLQYFMPAFAG